MLALRWGLFLTLLATFGDERGYAYGETQDSDGTSPVKPAEIVDWKVALRKAHTQRATKMVEQLDDRDASLEMDAYKHFLDPAPAAARAAEQAAALNKKMRRMSREARAQRELAESGDSVDLGESLGADPAADEETKDDQVESDAAEDAPLTLKAEAGTTVVANAVKEHTAAEQAAAAAVREKEAADTKVARVIGVQDNKALVTARAAAATAGTKSVAAALTATAKLKSMLQKHYNAASTKRSKAKGAKQGGTYCCESRAG